MMDLRSSGVLCHISSLPSSFGIGDLGPEAYRFVDFLSRSGQSWWQVLPLNPTEPGLGNSPYSSYSAFAFNHLFISPELLVKEGFLDKKWLKSCALSVTGKVDYERAAQIKAELLAKAYENYCKRPVKLRGFENFCALNDHWLHDYALFVVLKKHFGGTCWTDWAPDFRDHHSDALKDFSSGHVDDIEKQKFIQYLFYRQWLALQEYCSSKGIGLIGDIPIYVTYDSADAWVHPEFYKLDENKKQTFVAGVPPDYFSADGQRWGNPVYNWDKLKETGFAWWVKRVRHNLGLFDVVRIDHFRAFAQCWEIPAAEKTAVKGVWRDVPGEDLFAAFQKAFPKLPIIAEDLGIITKDVDALKMKFNLPGMRVLMFAFHNEYKKSRDLPENHTPLSVVYTGTHDNNTVRGWYENDITPLEKKNFKEYLGRDVEARDIHWVMIQLAMKSVANLAIISLPDLLGLGQEARMNRPSTIKGNWLWRYRPRDLGKEMTRKFARLTKKSDRSLKG